MDKCRKIKEFLEFYTNIRVNNYKIFKKYGQWIIIFYVDLDEKELSVEFDSVSPELTDKIDKLGFSLEDYSDGILYFRED
jgi:hypothetical protein